jgi:dipeptidyl-peptidase-3
MKRIFLSLSAAVLLSNCARTTLTTEQTALDTAPIAETVAAPTTETNFQTVTEQFADLRMLRYQVPGFTALPLKQKELLYYLAEAGYCGRDITYDQNYKHNLRVRRTLEAIWELNQANLGGADAKQAEALNVYTKRVWFSNGIHHHYSTRKFLPECSPAYFATLVRAANPKTLPLLQGETITKFLAFITPIIFSPNVAPKRVNQEAGKDLLLTSATNFYDGLMQREAENFYARKIDKTDPHPISYGLNSRLEKASNKVVEQVWSVKGMYGPAITQMVYWLSKAADVAENDAQRKALSQLILFYSQGDLHFWDDYNVAWVKDTESITDAVNGFIEVYGDPLGYRGTYESVVSFKDLEATKVIKAIADQAQWFEDQSPILPQHKKKNVVGITGKVITVVAESGDAAPSTPIGINLPNSTWIRKEYGSKSVSLGNIVAAKDLDNATSGVLDEFALNTTEKQRARQYGALAGKLLTDMHEVIGHASGQINPGVGTTKETLKSYASALEEARADLVALYYLPDAKLQEIGVEPSAEVAKAAYDNYLRNGLLVQLTRLQPGETVEEAHMRNRQLVARWVFEKGQKAKVVERLSIKGKTYFRINDYAKLRTLFGQLLREVQRITSEGDYAAGKNLIETYGVKADQPLHREVLARYRKLNIAPYQGFIQARLVPVESGGRITDVKLEYPADFAQQMLEFSRKYKYLPDYN